MSDEDIELTYRREADPWHVFTPQIAKEMLGQPMRVDMPGLGCPVERATICEIGVAEDGSFIDVTIRVNRAIAAFIVPEYAYYG